MAIDLHSNLYNCPSTRYQQFSSSQFNPYLSKFQPRYHRHSLEATYLKPKSFFLPHFQLSLRDNPLVVRFVKDMTLNPPTLLELAARSAKIASIPYGPEDLPRSLIDYLQTGNCCVNPNCHGRLSSSGRRT